AEDLQNPYCFVLSTTTCWNSYYCFATLLRSQRALQLYLILYLTDKSSTVIKTPQFWTYLDELVKHLLPFVSILDYLQRDVANLFDVAYAFGYVAQQYENDIHEFGYEMQKKIGRLGATPSFVGNYILSTISCSSFVQTIFRMTQIAAEMEWEEHIDNAKKIHKTVTVNRITNSNNSKTVTTHCETQLESSFEQRNERDNPIALDLTENMHIPILDELTTTSYDMQNCHSAEHEGLKIELQYLFIYALSQPSFVRTLQQDIENNF
ncbi:27939_t:CDS:2, partial [Dentiscutata erythropus]